MTTDPGPAAATYRQTALDRLSSPEQLDQMLEVTHLRSWLALSGLILLLVVAFWWSLVGSIPTRVSGEGILIRPGGLLDIYAQDSGIVKEFRVVEGQSIDVGETVATMHAPDLAAEIAELQTRLATLRERVQQIDGRVGVYRGLGAGALATARATEQRAIDEGERSIAALSERQQSLSVIASPSAGRVLEIKARPGDLVSRGAKLLSLESTAGDVKPLQAVVYVSSAVGKTVSVGMPVLISPSTAAREEYGFMLGRVSYVSDFPATRDGMMRVLANEELVAALSASGPPFAVYTDLLPDSRSPSGYEWSSGSGGDLKINGGTPCEVFITIREQRPIEMVLPLLRQASGL